MLLGVSFLAGFAGFDLLLAAWKGWSFTALLLGHWGQASTGPLGPGYNTTTGPKSSIAPQGQYQVPVNPNRPTVPAGPGGGPNA